MKEEIPFSSYANYPRKDHLLVTNADCNVSSVVVPLVENISSEDNLKDLLSRNGIGIEARQKCQSMIILLKKCDMMPQKHCFDVSNNLSEVPAFSYEKKRPTEIETKLEPFNEIESECYDIPKESYHKEVSDMLCSSESQVSSKSYICKQTADLFKCEECNYTSYNKVNFDIHMRKHTGNLLKCEECKYTSNRKDNFDSHMRKHTGNLFRCDVCEYTSAQKRNFESHMRKHTGNLFRCEVCKCTFNRKDNFDCHMRKHSDTLFKCD